MLTIVALRSDIEAAAGDETVICDLIRRVMCDFKTTKAKRVSRNEAVELLKYLGLGNLIERVENMRLPNFGLSANDVLSHVHQKVIIPELVSSPLIQLRSNALYDSLRSAWVASNFTLTNEQLLCKCDDPAFLSGFIVDKRKKSKTTKTNTTVQTPH